MTALAGILVLSPVLICLFAALMEKRRTVTSTEFFLAANQVSSFEFANSSIGYGFQIASHGYLGERYSSRSLEVALTSAFENRVGADSRDNHHARPLELYVPARSGRCPTQVCTIAPPLRLE